MVPMEQYSDVVPSFVDGVIAGACTARLLTYQMAHPAFVRECSLTAQDVPCIVSYQRRLDILLMGMNR